MEVATVGVVATVATSKVEGIHFKATVVEEGEVGAAEALLGAVQVAMQVCMASTFVGQNSLTTLARDHAAKMLCLDSRGFISGFWC